jgi:protein-S-isoprenylcysteine O-methyltransferase Ste14
MKRRISLNGVVLLLGVWAIVLFPLKIIRLTDKWWDVYLEVFGISCILLGQLVRVSARGYKSQFSGNSHFLVVSGPYSLVRNPMYLGILLIGLGVVLTLLYPWAIAVFILGFLIRYAYLFSKEEKELLKRFGKQYSSYMKQVPRIIPRLKDLFTRGIASYLPMRLSWLNSELPGIAAILLIVFAIESWEGIKFKGWQYLIFELTPFLVIFGLYIGLVILLTKYELDYAKNSNFSTKKTR